MTQVMSRQVVRHALDYASIPFGGELLPRLGRGDVPIGFPLLEMERPVLLEEPALLDRARLAEALSRTNAAMDNPLDDRMVEALRTDGWLVVGGQQPGLLLGPMYTVYKIISAIGVARCLCDAGVRAIPAFWIATEDHDLAEVDHFSIGTRTFRADHDGLAEISMRPPVGGVGLTSQREDVLRFLSQSLPPTRDRDWVLDAVSEADFTNYTTLFASLFVRVFGAGRVVLIDPMGLRDVLAPALAHVMDRWDAAEEGFKRGTARLGEAGFGPQLEKLTLFEVFDGVRRPVRGAVTGQDVLARPERYTPGAGIRPIVQDTALPVVATIGGPSEMLYQWQIDPAYEAVGLTRSRIYPRMGATWVERHAMRIAGRFRLTAPRVFEAVALHAHFDRMVLSADTPDTRELEAMRDAMLQRFAALDDGRNRKLYERASRSVRYQVGRVIKRMRLEMEAAAGRGPGDLRQLMDAILPGGEPQERVMSVFELIARHGVGVIDRLIEMTDFKSITHDVIEVQGDAV